MLRLSPRHPWPQSCARDGPLRHNATCRRENARAQPQLCSRVSHSAKTSTTCCAAARWSSCRDCSAPLSAERVAPHLPAAVVVRRSRRLSRSHRCAGSTPVRRRLPCWIGDWAEPAAALLLVVPVGFTRICYYCVCAAACCRCDAARTLVVTLRGRWWCAALPATTCPEFDPPPSSLPWCGLGCRKPHRASSPSHCDCVLYASAVLWSVVATEHWDARCVQDGAEGTGRRSRRGAWLRRQRCADPHLQC